MKQYPNEWPPERVIALRELFAQGHSFAIIAEQLSLTRMAVVGKCNRLGLRRDPAVTSRLRSNAGRVQHIRRPRNDSTKNKTFAKLVSGPKFSAIPLPPIAESDLAIPKRRRKNIFTLGPRDCKYPVGEPGTPSFFFCGARRTPALPYCAEHAARCFTPAKRP
jgi:GcrA cell cycle regulator